ncbi:hypothetical protein HYT57_02965 [Candidatus Woesearchaeota archaeon]|nr:hypothetical protein [Candidatus Woesearchaeota archaeon]
MVSEQEVKKGITAALRKYELVRELFPKVGEFIQEFRVLHAQLKGNDKLEVRVETRHDKDSKDWWRVPSLNAYFVPEKGEERKVLEHGTFEGGATREKLLYND